MGRGDWMERMRRMVRARHYLTTTELLREGFRRVEIGWAENVFRILQRVDRGLFVEARPARPVDLRWVLLHARVPLGIVSLETAAASQGLLPWGTGPLWVALPHSEHPPRSVIGGLAFQYLRAPWSLEELEPFSPPGMPGMELARFVPVRVFVELAAARRLGAATDVGRALLERGGAPGDLDLALLRRRVGAATRKRLLAAVTSRS
jgi:hypothetical protein